MSFRVTLESGKVVETCCPRCGLHYLESSHQQARKMEATDFATGNWVDAATAVYVSDSDMHPCAEMQTMRDPQGCCMMKTYDRCLPSLVAFAAKEQAGVVPEEPRRANRWLSDGFGEVTGMSERVGASYCQSSWWRIPINEPNNAEDVMKKVLLWSVAVAVAGFVAVWSVRAADETVTVKGEVLDMACYLDHGAHRRETRAVRRDVHLVRFARGHQRRGREDVSTDRRAQAAQFRAGAVRRQNDYRQGQARQS